MPLKIKGQKYTPKTTETPVKLDSLPDLPPIHIESDKSGFLKLQTGEKVSKIASVAQIPSSIKPFPSNQEIKERAKTKNYFNQSEYPNPDERYILNRAILHSSKDYKPKPIPNYPTLKQFTR